MNCPACAVGTAASDHAAPSAAPSVVCAGQMASFLPFAGCVPSSGSDSSRGKPELPRGSQGTTITASPHPFAGKHCLSSNPVRSRGFIRGHALTCRLRLRRLLPGCDRGQAEGCDPRRRGGRQSAAEGVLPVRNDLAQPRAWPIIPPRPPAARWWTTVPCLSCPRSTVVRTASRQAHI